ncbi:carbohydrate ABC transporter permease [Nocardioides panzhihuensis]|uniref:ABC-type glycerol-3-phosphate transport system permease component n=1 Tax=Nocardioides panzhihuensis TaxID=860243 RepID=A0A7Z0DNI6_9ACTN|nr:carbohydrate ABC transporter permease [Nocardioides panzhihuensis]NYI78899.1 ABC-type glycerol-3-phosphate transport system permease component [Nocardioides panzhihuensis]
MTLADEVAKASPQSTQTPARGRRPHRSRQRFNPSTPILVLIILASLVPFIWAFLTAIKPFTAAFTSPPTWTFDPTVKAFSDLYYGTEFVAVFINTMIVAAAAVIVSLAIAAPAAYGLARYVGSIGVWLLVLALVFRALPRFAVVLPFYDAARALGLYDTRTMLVIALVAINQPFTLWMLRNFFAAIPKELDESAMVDGCNRFKGFVYVILPTATPGLMTAGIFTFLLAYQEYLVAVALTQTDAVTLPVFVASFGTTEDAGLYQVIAASSIALAVPIVLLSLFAQRYLVAGLTGGAVKG